MMPFHSGEIMSDAQTKKPNIFKTFPYGEAALWLGFIVSFINAVDGYSSDDGAVMMAAVFALAAIGVRATRPVRKSNNV